ncbi:MAG: hypothetical protein ACXAEF_02055 [Candidatus Thorarchaeota archaeon]
MVTNLGQSDKEEQLLVTYLKGFTSRPTVVPTIYAIRFFCNELEEALSTLTHSPELMELLGGREDEKMEIQRSLHQIRQLFDEFLMIDLRK